MELEWENVSHLGEISIATSWSRSSRTDIWGIKLLGIRVGERFAPRKHHLFLLNDLPGVDLSGHAYIWGTKLLGIRSGECFAPWTDNLFPLHDLDFSGMI